MAWFLSRFSPTDDTVVMLRATLPVSCNGSAECALSKASFKLNHDRVLDTCNQKWRRDFFVNFKRLLDANAQKMPFVAAQIGLSFRNGMC